MWLKFLILGAVIGANNFAAAVALGAVGAKARRVRILFVFAVFEFFVPLIGLWLGHRSAHFIAVQAEWLGPVLLAGLGLWTLIETRRDSLARERLLRHLTSWRGLAGLAAILSIDNLVIGFGLGLGGADALKVALVIVAFSISFAWIGLAVGEKVHTSFETAAEIFSGVLLIALAMADWFELL